MRELREEEGLDIITNNDDASLKPGEYMLRSTQLKKLSPVFGRGVNKRVRAFVLDRNGFTCQMCGAVSGEEHHSYPGKVTRLHLGHIIDLNHGGSDEPSNLRALCAQCNEGASDLTLTRPAYVTLLSQVRRATREDHEALLAWLKQKYDGTRGAP